MHRTAMIEAGVRSIASAAGSILTKEVTLGAIALFAIGAPPILAADMAPAPRVYSKAPTIVAPTYSWTGCYLGIEGGGNWGRAGTTAVVAPNPATDGFPMTKNYDLSGGLAGGTVGCNYQAGNWVLGIEGDASWTDQTGSAFNIAPFTTTSTNILQEKWFDTVRGRIGYTWDRLLVYGTAGGAFAGTTTNVCTNTGVCVTDSETRSGWVAGGGIEYGFWDNLSLKLEYLHADFGGKNYISPPVVIPGTGSFNTRSIHLTDDIFRVGLNYRFGWGSPVVAKY